MQECLYSKPQAAQEGSGEKARAEADLEAPRAVPGLPNDFDGSVERNQRWTRDPRAVTAGRPARTP